MAQVSVLQPTNFEALFGVETGEAVIMAIDAMGATIDFPLAGLSLVFTADGLSFSGTPGADDFRIESGTVTGFTLQMGMMDVAQVTDIALDARRVEKAIDKGQLDKLVEDALRGNDSFTGSMGIDALLGGRGDDTLSGGMGDDTLDGGKGDDRAEYAGVFDTFTITEDNKVITLTDSSADDGEEGTDTLTDVEFIAFQDFIYEVSTGALWPIGTEMGEALGGSSQDDLIDGLGGNDTILGNDGNDSLFGGEGNDTLVGGEGKDTLNGGQGDDLFTVDKKDRVVEETGGGIDTIESAVSIKLVDNVENAVLTGTDKGKVKGNDLDNTITGNAGDNKLDGRDGNDVINGGQGDDKIRGGDGNDTLTGGGGDDDLRGGDGADVFRIEDGGPADVDSIRDFVLGEDLIDVSAIDELPDFMTLQGLLSDQGKEVAIQTVSSGTILIRGVDINELTESNFIFAMSEMEMEEEELEGVEEAEEVETEPMPEMVMEEMVIVETVVEETM